VRITQGAFSFLPDLTDEQIKKQVEYAISKGWAINVEWTDDPHPRNTYWDMWGLPLFDCQDAAAVMYELNECRKLNPEGYIKIQAFDPTLGVESCV
jgi:ribulose-bisphosphate carboxylase small chain